MSQHSLSLSLVQPNTRAAVKPKDASQLFKKSATFYLNKHVMQLPTIAMQQRSNLFSAHGGFHICRSEHSVSCPLMHPHLKHRSYGVRFVGRSCESGTVSVSRYGTFTAADEEVKLAGIHRMCSVLTTAICMGANTVPFDSMFALPTGCGQK